MIATTEQVKSEYTTTRKAEALRYLTMLGHARNAARTLPEVRTRYAGWEDVEALAEWAVEQSPPPDVASGPQGVFLVVNEIEEQRFLDFANGRTGGKTVADVDIDRRTEFYIDVDPTRFDDGGGKVCATDAEREWAEAALETVITVASAHGFPSPLVVDSGNGYQIYFRIDLPNDEDCKTLIKSVLASFAELIDCERGTIDASVGNAARLARIPGTYNRKGVHTADRPYRLTRIVMAPPGDVLESTDRGVLEEFVAWVAGITAARPKTSNSAAKPAGRTPLDAETYGGLVDEVQSYLSANDAPPLQHVRRDDKKSVLEFAYCPFRGLGHEDGGAAVLVWQDGGLGFRCFHDKCSDESWDSLQKLLGPSFVSDSLAEYAGAHGDRIRRNYNDPLILAQAHLERCRLDDGAPGLVFVHGELYRYVPEAGWRLVPTRELQAPVRETIQRAYDADFLAKPLRKYSTPVRAGDINNTVKAVESLAYFPVAPDVSPPFWLTDEYQSNPLDLLVLKNGILDVRAWVEGRPHFFPRTSQLFTEAVGAYKYDPARTSAPNWTAFLDSLDQGPEWRTLLQQIMGCTLCAGYDLQKIFMLVGPPRSGKGTIARTLEGLLGRQNICSPSLVDFAKPFGLEQTLGKRLAIVPEVAFPARDAHEIVATLKAISGGDMVTVDRKFIKNIPVRLNLKIMLVTNNIVALPDNSKALPGRLIPLRFTKSFLDNEDLELGQKLRLEQAGILNWSLEGFRSLYLADGRFTLPTSTCDLMDQLTFESAPLQAFIQDACVLDARKAVYKQAFYERYKKWSAQNGSSHQLLTVGDFNSQIQTAVPQLQAKRPSSRDYFQRDYTVVATAFDTAITSTRPEVWVGIFCRPEEVHRSM